MAKQVLSDFKVMTFDVVGTLIDFENGITDCLCEIGTEVGVSVDREAALAVYRKGRYAKDAKRFPDDLSRIYFDIARAAGLPESQELGLRLMNSAKHWAGFGDSADALARLAKRYRLVAMTNAQRWAFEYFQTTLGLPFWKGFTTDDTGTEKPDPAFFEYVFTDLAKDGITKGDILHVAQSQYHDIGISRSLGLTNCWIERRHAQPGYGGTLEPKTLTTPDFHFTSMAELADAVEQA